MPGGNSPSFLRQTKFNLFLFLFSFERGYYMFSSSRDFEKFTRIFILYLLLNPLIDLIGGVFINIIKTDFPITPGTAIRMAFMVFMGIYLIYRKDFRDIRYIILMLFAWGLNVVGQMFFDINKSLMSEAQYFARYLYNIIIIFVYEIVLKDMKLRSSDWKAGFLDTIVTSGVFYALVIIISFVTQTGFSTYAKGAEVGTKGFFNAGNDITAVLSIIFPIAMYQFISLQGRQRSILGRVLSYLAPIFIASSMVMLATRIAYASLVFSVIAFGVFLIFKSLKGQRKTFLYLSIGIAIAVGAIFVTPGGSKAISDSYERQKQNIGERQDEVITYVLSARNYKLQKAFEQYKSSNAYIKIFGTGRGSQQYTIEMDFFEVFIYYGIAGAILLLYPYLKRGIQFFIYSVKNIELENYALFLAMGIGAGTAFLAGHVLFSATAGIYLSLAMAFAYNKVLISQ